MVTKALMLDAFPNPLATEFSVYLLQCAQGAKIEGVSISHKPHSRECVKRLQKWGDLYEAGLYLIILPQPEFQWLSQAVAGGVRVVREDGFQVTQAKP